MDCSPEALLGPCAFRPLNFRDGAKQGRTNRR
jgi:hypothetical protein